MKGLLHRLAARAAGTALAVRSDARLPYAADALAWRGAAESPPAPLAGHPDSQRRPSLDRSASRAGDERPASIAATDTPPKSPLRLEPGQGAAVEFVSRAPAAPATAAPGDTNAVWRTTPVDGASPMTGTRRVDAPAPPGASNTPPARLLPAAPLPERPAASDPSHDPVHGAAALSGSPAPGESPAPWPHARRADPTSLLPAAPITTAAVMGGPRVPSATPGARPAGARPATPAAPADEPQEVHIHIGRIEVIAVHEAPARRPKPGTKTSPRSLDAYLAARSRT